jgi:hypothetical protein
MNQGIGDLSDLLGSQISGCNWRGSNRLTLDLEDLRLSANDF